MNRMKMTSVERAKRSHLTRLVSGEAFVRGTLSVRQRVCGKPNCRCARGQKHSAMYLSYSREGSVHQLFVPQEWQEQVVKWVKHYKDMKELLEELSSMYLEKITERKE